MKRPPSKSFSVEARPAARLAEALTLLVEEHAAEYTMSEGSVLGALTLVLGWMTGGAARRCERDFDSVLTFVMEHLRRVASAEFTRRPFTLH